MGLLKMSNAATGKVVSCDNVVDVVSGSTGSGATEVITIDISYGVAVDMADGSGSKSALLKAAITYAAPGAGNEYTSTKAEVEAAWLKAIADLSGATGSMVEAPGLGVKVTATGAILADAVPTLVIKHSAELA
jgi:hypothetical protein|tara:strand:- start:335 stop:733 length:399 start_codon:yes stop_codon:yes gene_type:complete